MRTWDGVERPHLTVVRGASPAWSETTEHAKRPWRPFALGFFLAVLLVSVAQWVGGDGAWSNGAVGAGMATVLLALPIEW